MNADKERFKLCLQCCEEFLSRDRASKLVLFCKCTMVAIKDNIRGCRSWRNEVELQSGHFENSDKLCEDCPYVLEHFMIKENE